MPNEFLLECYQIDKSFGGTHALDHVDLKIKSGEVHALVGENGAGKSTLMKIVIGLFKPDSGQMVFEGAPYEVNNPADAIDKGISMIFQELNPEPYLTIAEHIFLNREDVYRNTPILNKKKTNQRAQAILDKFKFPLGCETLMGSLTLAQVQMIEIIKAVSSDAKLIIMDEPTSSLDNEETERLFRTIRDLKEDGVAVIYISHRIEEIFGICDCASVLRDGHYIGSKDVKNLTKSELISMMVGRKVENIFPKVDVPIGDVVLKVEGLSGHGFEDISFDVHSGEILGFSGLVGSGRSETMRALFGLDEKKSGTVYLNGKKIDITSPHEAIKNDIAMVNEDRKTFGLCLFRSIRENISLPNLWNQFKGILINMNKEKTEARRVAERLRVKAGSIEDLAFSLSGGNQQKVVLSKWLLSMPKVLILDEPTRGIDVGAKAEIHSLVCEFARNGMAIIMVSSELPEVMGMSDRILIYHEGKINGEVHREQILSGEETQKTILAREFGEKVVEGEL